MGIICEVRMRISGKIAVAVLMVAIVALVTSFIPGWGDNIYLAGYAFGVGLGAALWYKFAWRSSDED